MKLSHNVPLRMLEPNTARLRFNSLSATPLLLRHENRDLELAQMQATYTAHGQCALGGCLRGLHSRLAGLQM
jgi:hypothetical protein